MVMQISGPPWVVSIPPVSGAGKAVRTYVLGGSSINAYNHEPQYPTLTFVDQGNGRARASGTKVARTFRKGMRVRVQGHATPVFNQFLASVVDHDTSSTLGWFEYTITGAYSPVSSTIEVTPMSAIDLTPDASKGCGAWAQQALGRNWRCIGNFAIAGGDSEQDLAAFDSTVAALRPNYAVWDPSTNDFYARGWAASRTIAATLTKVIKCLAIGTVPVVVLPSPRSSGVTGGTLAEHLAFIAWAREVLPGLGAIVIDPARTVSNGLTFVNSGNANYNPNSGFLHDGVHYDRAGARAVGLEIGRLLANQIPKAQAVHIVSAADAAAAKSWFKNVSLTASPGTAPPTGFTGANIPEGVTVSRSGSATAVASLVARTVANDGDAYGNNLVLVITGTANNDGVTAQFSFSPAGLNAGDVLRSALALKCTSQSGVRQVTVTTRLRYVLEDGIYGNRTANVWNAASPASALNDDIAGDIDIPDINLTAAGDYPATLDTVYVEVTVLFGAAGGATLSMAHPTVLSYTP